MLSLRSSHPRTSLCLCLASVPRPSELSEATEQSSGVLAFLPVPTSFGNVPKCQFGRSWRPQVLSSRWSGEGRHSHTRRHSGWNTSLSFSSCSCCFWCPWCSRSGRLSVCPSVCTDVSFSLSLPLVSLSFLFSSLSLAVPFLRLPSPHHAHSSLPVHPGQSMVERGLGLPLVKTFVLRWVRACAARHPHAVPGACAPLPPPG